MSVQTGDPVTIDFTTRDPSTGAAADADTLPAGTLVVNGTDDAATVTVTNKATGIYKAAVVAPALAAGDRVQLRVAATVGGVADNAVVWEAHAEARQTGDAYGVVNSAAHGNAALKGVADAIKLKTDNLPATPAAAGDQMALTAAAQSALVAAIEAELANDATGGQLMQAIADKLAADFDIENLTVTTIANAARDAILNRVLAVNHETAGSVGKLLQKLNVAGTLAHSGDADTYKAAGYATTTQLGEAQTAILTAVGDPLQLGEYTAPANAAAAAAQTAAEAALTKLDALTQADPDTGLPQFTATAVENAPAGGGGSGGLTAEQDAKLGEIHLKTQLLGTGEAPTVNTSVPLGGKIELREGEDRVAAAGNPLQLSDAAGTNLPAVGTSLRLQVRHGGYSDVFEVAGAVVAGTAPERIARFDVPRAAHAGLQPGNYTYWVYELVGGIWRRLQYEGTCVLKRGIVDIAA